MKIADVMSNIVGPYGLASSNRYQVSFEFNRQLAEATGVNAVRDPSYMERSRIASNAEKVSYLADEVNFPGFSVSTGEFEGHVPGMNQKYAHTKTFRDFSITFLMDHNHLPYKMMQRWGEYIFPYQNLGNGTSYRDRNYHLTRYYEDYTCDMVILKMENENPNNVNPVSGLYLHNAYPYIINDMTVSNGPNQPLKFQASFYYEYSRFLTSGLNRDSTSGVNDQIRSIADGLA